MFSIFRRIILLKATTARLDRPDDPAFPYKLEVSLSPPEFMRMAFISQFGGSEDIVVGGKSRRAIERFAKKHGLRTHPRLRHLTVTGPTGILEQLSAQVSPS
jgi:hypothetical protein